MSDREKLLAAIKQTLTPIVKMDPTPEADAVIRQVVEACCAKADEAEGGFTSIAAVLRSTFLPLPTPKENERG